MSVIHRDQLDRSLTSPASSCALKLSMWGLSCKCSDETIHCFSHLQMEAILLIFTHGGPGKPLRICIEESNRYCCFYCVFPNIGGALIKAFATRRNDPSGLYASYEIQYRRRPLATLSSNEKQGSTSNSWQKLDKKGIFYSQLSRKGRRSETLGTGGTCCYLDSEPWTRCQFNEETWSEEQVTSQVCHFTVGKRSHFSLSFRLHQPSRSIYSHVVAGCGSFWTCYAN